MLVSFASSNKATMDSTERQKRKRDVCNKGSTVEGLTEDEVNALLHQHQSKVDELQNKCQSQQNELDSIKRSAHRMRELDGRSVRLEKELRVDWDYCAPPLPSEDEEYDYDDGDNAEKILERRCDYLEERCRHMVEILSILESITEFRRVVSPNYWEEQGFDEEYSVSMGKFQRHMIEVTSRLRNNHGQYGKLIYLNPYRDEESSDAEDEEGLIIGHHEVFMPYWRELINALRIQHFNSISTFSIHKIQLYPEVLDMLACALKMKITETLDLGDNNFRDAGDGVDFLYEVASNNPSINQLCWYNNPIDSMVDLNHLGEAIQGLKSLKHINLKGCCGRYTNGYHVLRSVLSQHRSITSIAMASSNIKTTGETHLSDFLATNPQLSTLDLENNHLTDEDALQIADSLKGNTNLETFEFHSDENEITGIGNKALADVVYDSTTLNAINDCNHTCFIRGTYLEYVFNNNRRFFDNPEENKKNKLYLVLSARHREGTNVHHLDLELRDDSLKLAHLVLGRINQLSQSCHEYGRYDRHLAEHMSSPLSLVYEILRGWRMPELFEQS